MTTHLRQDRSTPLVIGNGIVTDGVSLFMQGGAVLIQGDRIVETGLWQDMRAARADLIDVGGRLILPGFLNAHHHLYSSLAVGLAPLGETDSFIQVLDNLWWSLDLALDEESIYYSAVLGLIESVKHGVTMVFDHHASMGCIRGSLSLIEDAFRHVGIKGALCFETSDRMGTDQLEAQIRENLERAHDVGKGTPTRRFFGLHANLTLSEATLEQIGREKPAEMPIHIHCGEDREDLEHCRRLGYQGPVDRLNHFGLITSDSLLIHAIHLSERDYRLLEELRPIVVSNPESNANNRVGSMKRERIGNYLLGTDGMSPDMLETLRSHYLLGGTIPFAELRRSFFEHRYAVQQRFFPDTGSLSPGARADLVVLDYVPATPIDLDSLIGHLIFGARGGKAYLTMSDGRVLYQAGRVITLNEEEVREAAIRTANRLHERYYHGRPFSQR